MMMPKRIKMRRRKGWRLPQDASYVGRPTKWGNPFVVQPATRARKSWQVASSGSGRIIGREMTRESAAMLAVRMFTHYIKLRLRSSPDLLNPLEGRDLACWCPSAMPCHADVLLQLANTRNKEITMKPNTEGRDD